MMKKELVSLCLAGLALTSAARNNTRHPNIILIVADDLGWGDVGYHGSEIRTPNIDAFVNDGIELDRYYVSPISSPTRAGLMTGRYPNRFGFRESVLPPWRKGGLPLEEETFADMLGRCGYKNRAMIGKWHLGHSCKAYHPLERGFTHFHGLLNGAFDYFTHKREGEIDWHDDWDTCREEGYSTDLIGSEAVRCIEEYSQTAPYFLYVAFNAPHTPYQAPEEEIAKYLPLDQFRKLGKKDQDGWIYRAMVSRMDTNIGRILFALDKSGQADNTIVLFMSDNGGVPGMEPYSRCLPLKGHKFDEWEGGVRVPAAIRWPEGFISKSQPLNQVISFVDILPTVADILDADAPARPYDGISMYPVLSGKRKRIDRILYLGLGAAVGQNFKLIIPTKNKGLRLKEEYFTNIIKDPCERSDGKLKGHNRQRTRLRKVIKQYDSIKPAMPEQPYGKGKKGFRAPKEWDITTL